MPGTEMPRADALRLLVGLVEARRADGRPTTVAVDGPDAAGKTTLADELARALRACGDPVVRVSLDGFHNPRAIRAARGVEAPEATWHDAFDLAAFRAAVLAPIATGGDGVVRTAVHDLATDLPVHPEPLVVPHDAVVVVDGLFLLRAELDDAWDARIHVTVAPEETIRRAIVRDTAAMGSPEEVGRRYRRRYLPAQDIYRAAARPEERADVVVVNDTPARPVLAWRPRAHG